MVVVVVDGACCHRRCFRRGDCVDSVREMVVFEVVVVLELKVKATTSPIALAFSFFKKKQKKLHHPEH